MIQNIVFDMGNVLINYDAAEYVRAYVEDAEDRRLVTQELFGSLEWVKLDRGTITDDEALAAICARLPRRLHSAVNSLLQHWYEGLVPLPEIGSLVRELKDLGYGIYLLSNASINYHKFRGIIPAIDLFDGEFVSADHHLIKPDPAVYQAFCQRFSLDPASCFFIDDFPLNIEAAMRMGMQGFVYHKDLSALRCALLEAGVPLRQEPKFDLCSPIGHGKL